MVLTTFFSIDYMTLNPDQDALDEKSSPPNPVPAFKRGICNVGRAPGQLVRVLSQTRGTKSNSTAEKPEGPAYEIGELCA